MSKKKIMANTKERGITLLSLVITIIILVILASIVIRTIAGNDGLIEITLTAKETSTIANYKEQIALAVQTKIVEDNLKGIQTTRATLAEEILVKVQGVIKTIPDEESKAIIIVTEEGYIFQVYYDEVYGSLETEYTGKIEGDPKEEIIFPKVTGEYISSTATIKVNASISTGKITKVELIYREEIPKINGKEAVVEINAQSGTANFEIGAVGRGEYKVRVTTDKGIQKTIKVYATDVSDTLEEPVITVETAANSAGWYGKAKVPVRIVITKPAGASNETKKATIRYRVVAGLNQGSSQDNGTEYQEGHPIELRETRNIHNICMDNKWRI